jgi:hypothetical protein
MLPDYEEGRMLMDGRTLKEAKSPEQEAPKETKDGEQDEEEKKDNEKDSEFDPVEPEN